MRTLRVLAAARVDAVAILAWTDEQLGLETARRYSRLLGQAYADLCKDPDRPGVTQPPQLEPGIRLYAIRHSLPRLTREDRLRTARHVVAFTFDSDELKVARLLHDSMDIPARLHGDVTD